MNIPNGELNEWLLEMKPYQRQTMLELINLYGEEQAVDRWLLANGPSATVKFGGDGEKKSYKERFKLEVNKFICGHPDYEKERSEFEQQGECTKELLVSTISAAVGSQIGVAATVLAPATVLLLYTIGKMGVKAYCRNVNLED